MSLADLYKNDSPNESSDEEVDFVPDEASSDEYDEPDENQDQGDSSRRDSPSNERTEDEDEAAEQRQADKKRKIDAIWEEMNAAPAPPKHGASAEGSAPTPRSDSTTDPAPSPKVDTEPGTPRSAELVANERAAPQLTSGDTDSSPLRRIRAPRKRKASKFSRMVEVVESRRAKKESTLDRAKREWAGFVKKEDLREDLDKANKDGYVERQEFLTRVDERSYERSRQRK